MGHAGTSQGIPDIAPVSPDRAVGTRHVLEASGIEKAYRRLGAALGLLAGSSAAASDARHLSGSPA